MLQRSQSKSTQKLIDQSDIGKVNPIPYQAHHRQRENRWKVKHAPIDAASSESFVQEEREAEADAGRNEQRCHQPDGVVEQSRPKNFVIEQKREVVLQTNKLFVGATHPLKKLKLA